MDDLESGGSPILGNIFFWSPIDFDEIGYTPRTGMMSVMSLVVVGWLIVLWHWLYHIKLCWFKAHVRRHLRKPIWTCVSFSRWLCTVWLNKKKLWKWYSMSHPLGSNSVNMHRQRPWCGIPVVLWGNQNHCNHDGGSWQVLQKKAKRKNRGHFRRDHEGMKEKRKKNKRKPNCIVPLLPNIPSYTGFYLVVHPTYSKWVITPVFWVD